MIYIYFVWVIVTGYALGYKIVGVNIKMRGKTVMYAVDSAVVIQGRHKAWGGVDAYKILILPLSPLETPDTPTLRRPHPHFCQMGLLYPHVLLIRAGKFYVLRFLIVSRFVLISLAIKIRLVYQNL
jgi:hypothetical protein